MMNTNEIMVSVVGVLLGYWIIGAVVGSKKPPSVNDMPEPNESSYQETMGGQSHTNQKTQEKPPAGNPNQAWYEVLVVSKSASLEEVQAAYRSLIRQYHPDKVAALGEELRELAERKSKAINKAYNEALAVVGDR